MSRKRIAEREKGLLQFIALEKWRDSPVANLSGGMKHRVSLALQHDSRAEAAVLDEPTVAWTRS